MNFEKYATKKTHKITLLIGITAMIGLFAVEMYLASAGAMIATVGLLALIKRKSETPIEDERDMSIAKDSVFKAFTWTGVLGGLIMIVITVGMGLGEWSYPDWIAPYYLTWGAIMLLAIIIEALNRSGIKLGRMC